MDPWPDPPPGPSRSTPPSSPRKGSVPKLESERLSKGRNPLGLHVKGSRMMRNERIGLPPVSKLITPSKSAPELITGFRNLSLSPSRDAKRIKRMTRHEIPLKEDSLSSTDDDTDTHEQPFGSPPKILSPPHRTVLPQRRSLPGLQGGPPSILRSHTFPQIVSDDSNEQILEESLPYQARPATLHPRTRSVDESLKLRDVNHVVFTFNAMHKPSTPSDSGNSSIDDSLLRSVRVPLALGQKRRHDGGATIDAETMLRSANQSPMNDEEIKVAPKPMRPASAPLLVWGPIHPSPLPHAPPTLQRPKSGK